MPGIEELDYILYSRFNSNELKHLTLYSKKTHELREALLDLVLH